MNPLSLLAAALQAVANYFGWSLQRSQVKNTQEMKDRVEQQKEQNAVADVNKAIANKDLDAVRKELAE